MSLAKHYRKNTLPSTISEGEMHFVNVGGAYVQYVVNNSGVAIPPAVMAHSHSISDISGLQAALDLKSPSSHTHANATASAPGFMSANDKIKLDSLSNYSHPNSGVAAGTYRSVTVNAQGHVTAGSNPTSLAGYGITDQYTSVSGAYGFASPDSNAIDLNAIGFTSNGYATNAQNRPAGSNPVGYFHTISNSSASFFQTFANPSVQDAFFFRRKNTSVVYDWMQIASREWVTTNYGAPTLSGTAGKYAIFTTSSAIGDGILSNAPSGVSVEGQFISNAAPAGGPRGLLMQNGGVSRWGFGKVNAESGADSGSDLIFNRFNDSGASLGAALLITRANGNAAFSGLISASGGNSSNWNAAYSWGNHSGLYVPTGRVLTINGVSFDLSANRSWTVSGSGGVAGTGTPGAITKWVGNGTIGSSAILTESGIALSVAGNFESNFPSNAGGPRGLNLLAGGSLRWSLGKFGNETGGSAGSDLVFIRYNDSGSQIGTAFSISRGSGDVTIPSVIYTSSGNSNSWSTAYNWGNHASFGYITSSSSNNLTNKTGNISMWSNNSGYITGINSGMITNALGYTPVGTARTLSINGVTYDLSANRSWTISTGGGGIAGSGSFGYLARWLGSSNIGNSRIYDDGSSPVQIQANLQVAGYASITQSCVVGKTTEEGAYGSITSCAVFQVKSTIRGSIPCPVMTENEMVQIQNPVHGLMAAVRTGTGAGLWFYFENVGWRILSTRLYADSNGTNMP